MRGIEQSRISLYIVFCLVSMKGKRIKLALGAQFRCHIKDIFTHVPQLAYDLYKGKHISIIMYQTTVVACSPVAIIGTFSPRSGLWRTSCSCRLALR